MFVFHPTSAKIHCAIIKLNFIRGIWSSGLDEKCYLSACGQMSWAPVDLMCWKPVLGVVISQTEVWTGGPRSSLLGFPLSKATDNISGLLGPPPTMRCFPKAQFLLVQQHCFSPGPYWEESCWLGEPRRSADCLQPLQTDG